MPTYAGLQLSASRIRELAVQAGWKGSSAITITAIAIAESRGYTGAVGDETLAGQKTDNGKQTWGESYGLTQVRSIREERGTGSSRDASILTDPLSNLKAALEIYMVGARAGRDGFRAWSTYTGGQFKAYLAAATRGEQAPTIDGATGTDPTGAVGGTYQPFLEAIGGISTALTVDINSALTELKLDGISNLDSAVIDAPVSFSTTQVSEIKLTIDDPGLKVCSKLRVGALAGTYADWVFRVAALDPGPGPTGTGETVVTLRSAIAQNLKHDPYVGPASFPSMSASQAIKTVVKYLVAEPSDPSPTNLVVNGPDNGPASKSKKNAPQTYWDAFQSWADDEGFWLFESAGTIYFGRPSWLVAVLPSVTFRWNGKPEGALLQFPQFRVSEDGEELTTVTLRLHWTLGRKIRPGMAIKIEGVGSLSAPYIVTSVEGNLRSIEPWTVQASFVKDPVPTDKTEAATTGSDAVDAAGALDGFDVSGEDPGNGDAIAQIGQSELDASELDPLPDGSIDTSSDATIPPAGTPEAAATPTLNAADRGALVTVALGQVGTKEGANNWNPYAAFVGHANNARWCATFVVWCAKKAGVKLLSTSASTVDHYNAAVAAGRLEPTQRKAEPGWLVLYDFEGTDGKPTSHIGIVQSDDGYTLHTIEGNTRGEGTGGTDGVYARARSRRSVVGFIRM